jgi:hypothetical protein
VNAAFISTFIACLVDAMSCRCNFEACIGKRNQRRQKHLILSVGSDHKPYACNVVTRNVTSGGVVFA